MKILILQDRLRSGGTERQSVLLSNAFCAAGHSTGLLTFRPGGPLADTVAKEVTHTALQPFDTGLDWFAPGLTSHIREARPDILLCMGRMANCHAGRLQRRFPGLAVIGTMRTGKKLPAPYRRSLMQVRAIVANSHEARANLTALYGVEANKISVIHNSLVFQPAPSADMRKLLRAEHHATDKTFVMICVAMFRPEKNQRELIEIAAQMPPGADWQLWLVGTGPALAACQALVRQKQLDHHIRFLGWRRDPAPCYAAADAAVHASRSEALSNFLIEAQAGGLPVVAYEAQGIAESCLPDDTGFITKRGDRAAFLRHLDRLMRSSEGERQALAKRAQDHARDTFHHDRQVARYLELFSRLIR